MIIEAAIRKYTPGDKAAVRDICVETALLGAPVDACFDDREIAADIMISYYTDFEPGSCFVAVLNDKIAGYVAGCTDAAARRRKTILFIIPPVLVKLVCRGLLPRKKTLLLCKNFLSGFIAGDFFNPDFSRQYRASLHINVAESARGMGIGGKLLDEYLKHLASEQITGATLETKSEKAVAFFRGHGFIVLFSKKISYLEYLGFSNLKLFIMGLAVRR